MSTLDHATWLGDFIAVSDPYKPTVTLVKRDQIESIEYDFSQGAASLRLLSGFELSISITLEELGEKMIKDDLALNLIQWERDHKGKITGETRVS